VLGAVGNAAVAVPPLPEATPVSADGPSGAGLPPAVATPVALPVGGSLAAAGVSWEQQLQAEARQLLEQGQPAVWDMLTQRFERSLIEVALACTRGRRIEAAHKLGIGRNTITRKIQELGMDD
jgi:two-component system nitrogen regulation response regulator GlnG